MKRILVIDDDDAIRAMLRKLFTANGFDVSVAENGKEAVRRQEEGPFDLIVTDLVMPEKEGIETIMEFRKKYPATKIIAISGGGQLNSGEYYLELAGNLGAHKTLAKPFTHSEILAAVKELFAE
jgi:DNA-binding response OmpR family regulator